MSIFSSVPVKKPRMSAFDLSYNNYFTCDMGELIPAFVMPIMPGDRVQYAPTFQVRFAPMVNPVFADIYAKVECFFVPYRLVWDYWKTYITDCPDIFSDDKIPSYVPCIVLGNGRAGQIPTSNELDASRLVDYLGGVGFYRYVKSLDVWPSDSDLFDFNCLPFRAYTLIWNEYYRDEFIEPAYNYGVNGDADNKFNIGSGSVALSEYGIFRRRWRKDYFTTATPTPQYGDTASGVDVQISGTSVTNLKGKFTIAQFRVANALQRFLEKTNIGGGRYNEFILAHFGCMPTDATIQRPEFLGSVLAPVQVMSVSQTSQVSDDSSSATKNNVLGSQAGQMSAVGTKLCFRRSFKEYGVILGLFSVFPKPVYSDGINRYLFCGTPYSDRFAFGFPEFAGVGDQEIYKFELKAESYLNNGREVFGYQQRYSEFKFNNDEVHGDFALTDSGLSQYTFARFFSASPSLNSDFLECVPRADCFVLRNSDTSTNNVNQCWVQLRNNVKAIRPLPKFSTPTL